MNGGPYGRGNAPERASLKIDQWPEPDRRLWLDACAPGGILDDEVGARSNRAAISNAKAAKGYGRWLTFLATSARESSGRLRPIASPASECAPMSTVWSRSATRH